jgi:CRP-like cAMP-binding protein
VRAKEATIMEESELALHAVPLLAGLPAAELETLANCGSNVSFREGDLLFSEGEEADAFYVLRRGSIALETFVPARGAVTIETLDAGDLVGWSWLFPPYRWHFDARALEPVDATRFDGPCLRRKCEADPQLGFDLLSLFAQIVIERLQWTRLRLLDVYGHAGSD